MQIYSYRVENALAYFVPSGAHCGDSRLNSYENIKLDSGKHSSLFCAGDSDGEKSCIKLVPVSML
jgi:hypothetical protein